MSKLKGPFRATLDATNKGLSELLPLLRQEQAALTGKDPEALEQVVQAKVALLQEMEHSVLAREQILQQAGCGSGLDGSEQFVRQQFTPDEILSDWKRLLSLSKQVDELNTQNGKLALAGERATRQALGILTGRSQEQDPYARHRPSGGPNNSNSLGKC